MLARRLWAITLGGHRRTVLRRGWGRPPRPAVCLMQLSQPAKKGALGGFCFLPGLSRLAAKAACRVLVAHCESPLLLLRCG